MIHSRRLHVAGRLKPVSMAIAIAAAAIVWTLGVPDTAGVKREFDASRRTLRPSGHPPSARVIALSGSASVLWAGRSRPLAVGTELAAGEVVITDARSMVVVETPDGGVYRIFPESRVGFRENRWTWPGLVDQWLNRVRTNIQSFGGPPQPDRLSCPTAVMAVRAATLPFPARDATSFAKRWSRLRSRV